MTFTVSPNAHFPAVRPLREYGRESRVSGTMLLFTLITTGKDAALEPKMQAPEPTFFAIWRQNSTLPRSISFTAKDAEGRRETQSA
ncbi:MAG: hypothetical protein NZM43_11485 [Saprospiraceae bacterium]|nr:hypothetical protein [Saprospiraceae bacterium]MDW8484930.1 hypothetical protein [Saprospiraceae bacterium]